MLMSTEPSGKAEQDLPPAALLISSPYDPDARYRVKRTTMWTGAIGPYDGDL